MRRVELAGLAALTVALASAPATAWAFTPSGKLEIHYINVQQGGSTLVIGPDGTTVLMDAGNNGKGTSEIVPYLQSIGLLPADGLDYTLAAHLDADHCGGFDDVIAAGYDVRVRNYNNGSAKTGATIDDYYAACAGTTAGAAVAAPLGLVIDLGAGATLTVVAVHGDVLGVGHVSGAENNENDLSAAVLVEHGSFDFVWGSDLGGGEDDAACTGRSTTQVNVETPVSGAVTPGGPFPFLGEEGVDVLHVNHHGSESSTNSDWMNRLKPEVAVISVGAGQGPGWDHPRVDVVSVLRAQVPCVTAPPALVLQTEEGAPTGSLTSFAGHCCGDIVIKTDGVASYRIEATGAVSQGPDERAAAGLPRDFAVDEGGGEPPPPPPTTIATYTFGATGAETNQPASVAANVAAGGVVTKDGAWTFFAGVSGVAIADTGWADNHFELQIAPAAGFRVTLAELAFQDRASSTGPTSFQAYVVQGANALPAGGGPAHQTFTANTVAIPGAAAGPFTEPFSVRIVGAGASSSAGTWRIDDLVLKGTIAATNGAPVANAGPDQPAAGEGATVALDGTGSTDPDGDALAFAWTQVAGPVVALSSPAAAVTTFAAPGVTAATVLTFRLTVDDGRGGSAFDEVTVTVQDTVNEPPSASAGSDLTVLAGAAVALDGTGSSDPNGEALAYAWTQTAGAPVALAGADTPTPSFTAPGAADALAFSLTVTDARGAPATDSVVVTVRVNAAPAADAGADLAAGEGEAVVLLGSGGDPDGDAISFSWTQVSGPAAAAVAGADTATPTVTAPAVTAVQALVFRLTVTDALGASASDEVTLTVADSVNEPPVASAGADAAAGEGEALALDGTGSSDPNGEALTFAWAQVSGPAASIAGAGTATPTVTAPAVFTAQTLVFRLTVTDARGGTDTDDVSVAVANSVNEAPTADAGADQVRDEGTSVALSGAGSSDPNGEALTYSWVQTAGPPVALSGAGTATPSFTAPEVAADTVLAFALTVADVPHGATATDSVDVTVRNRPAATLAFDGWESNSSSGGTGWRGNWTRSGDQAIVTSDGPHGGARHLRLRQSSGYARRSVNLAGASGVRLRFWAKVVSFEGSDQALVRVSPDGVTYTTVRTFTAADGDGVYRFYDLDLSGFAMTSDFRIAFDAQMSGSGDRWFIDDIEVYGLR